MKKVFLLLSIFLLSGCSFNPVMQGAAKAPSYNQQVDALSIIFLAKKLGAEVGHIKQEEFEKISEAFMSAGIAPDLYFASGLNFDEQEKLKYYSTKNNYFLIIDPTARTTGDTQNVTYQLSLYDTRSNRKVWVSNLWVPFSWTEGIYQRFDDMGALIVDQLSKDGLVPGLGARVMPMSDAVYPASPNPAYNVPNNAPSAAVAPAQIPAESAITGPVGYAKQSVELRTQPHGQAPVQTTVPAGAALPLRGRQDNRDGAWWYTLYDSKAGWVDAASIGTPNPR